MIHHPAIEEGLFDHPSCGKLQGLVTVILDGPDGHPFQLRDPHFELLAREGGLLLKKLLHLGKGVGDIHYFFQES